MQTNDTQTGMTKMMNPEQFDAMMSEDNLNRVHDVMQEISRENDLAFHKAALIESVVLSRNAETGYGESIRVIE